MAEISKAETAKIIRDLLVVAKVAMPADLFREDPRVLIARAALQDLERAGAQGRPPNVTSRAPTIDLTRVSTSRPVEMSTAGVAMVLDLPWDLVDGLSAACDAHARLDIAETAQFGLRDWLTGQGYLPARPDVSDA